ncbi:Sodium, potassium, lithium and rubidium/H(+) antiporter [Alphaproteobacteria bacterium SO-S41]|nr:Sodium, potassium, lithium and rubidium/H(+) antiporter [Alphaproteobacteria bacterium SO-S41]
MLLFESTLTLILVAIVLLQVSRKLAIPYPAMLAMAGVGVAALPWAPDIAIDPHLALALFIAPALLDAGFDFPPRAVRRFWLPLIALAAVAVVLTTAAVAWLGVAWGLPMAAAIALGAIVAPPDAAAASAMLARLSLPRRTVTVLKGESLLNDATSLLIFGAAVAAASAPDALADLAPELALAVPGGLIFGILIGRAYVLIAPRLAGTLGGTLFEFVATFGVWIVAERLHLSPILSVVAYAMTIAHFLPAITAPRHRVHSYAVWEAAVFLLNVIAFLLMGLQAREIVGRLDAGELNDALVFAAIVLGVVVAVRVVWVMFYNRAVNWSGAYGTGKAPTIAQGLVVSWCGMRGLVTLATALALPAGFPERDLIVLSALAVVLGTLVIQGLTLGPLIRVLGFTRDTSFDSEVAAGRVALIDAGLASLDSKDADATARLRADFAAERAAAEAGSDPRAILEIDRLRRRTIAAKRTALAGLRRSGEMEDDVFHALEEELDWDELAVTPADRLGMEEG